MHGFRIQEGLEEEVKQNWTVMLKMLEIEATNVHFTQGCDQEFIRLEKEEIKGGIRH